MRFFAGGLFFFFILFRILINDNLDGLTGAFKVRLKTFINRVPWDIFAVVAARGYIHDTPHSFNDILDLFRHTIHHYNI